MIVRCARAFLAALLSLLALPLGVDAGVGIMVRPEPGRYVYLADYANNAIIVFGAGVSHPSIARTISAGVDAPVAVAVDAAGTLYVANAPRGKHATVVEYSRGSAFPNAVISLGTEIPRNLAVGPDGTVYAASATRVFEYARGAANPTRVVETRNYFPYPISIVGIAVSADDYLYVNAGSGNAGGGYLVNVYKPEHLGPFKRLGLNNPGYPGGGLCITDGRLFVGDPLDGQTFVEALPDFHQADARSVPTGPVGDYIAVDPASHDLYAVASGQTLEIVDLYSGRLIGTVNGSFRGVAVDPVSL